MTCRVNRLASAGLNVNHHMRQPLEPIDSRGMVITIGTKVKISHLPEWLAHDLPNQEVLRLKTIEGLVMQVLEIDQFGYLWFGTDNQGRWFCLRPEEVEVVTAT